ncbi:hypothetical protein GWL_29580 [Herbaspirillum sp. GW103]|uniref:DUF3606 domain-containing protein n=1 Tax=Herbaspirillum sp. GW103 TaxID=1175306 RepID=UPI00025E2EFC|nr:DUF3606 domain-containing protein [Herbaspirillum sp. GW103]EIJ45930.1 hypothetical protein GWL_29580 [Herbaspirillum sp. GW103]
MDDLSKRGQPDRSLLNRHEKWEVDYFVKQFSQQYGTPPSQGVEDKARRLILSVLPSDVRQRDLVSQWLLNNWQRYH